MKKIITVFLLLFFISCGSKDEKKKGFEYNRTQKIDKKSNDRNMSKTPIDLDNKGIGPIKKVDFETTINNDLAEKGKATFNQKALNLILPVQLRQNEAVHLICHFFYLAYFLSLINKVTNELKIFPSIFF